MKANKHFILAGVLALVSAAGALAQTNSTAVAPVRQGQVIVPENLTATDASTTVNLRPARTERPKLPPEVLARIEKFKQEARAYLEKQQALKKKLEGANDKDKALLRDQMKQLREQWLERARELRKEFKDRQIELIDKLPGHRELLESIRDDARAQLIDAADDTRPRRGVD